MKTKYNACAFAYTIKQVEILRETKTQVILNDKWERRNRKISEYDGYFDTFEEAKQWLLDNCNRKVNGLQGQLERAQDQLNTVNSLTENK